MSLSKFIDRVLESHGPRIMCQAFHNSWSLETLPGGRLRSVPPRKPPCDCWRRAPEWHRALKLAIRLRLGSHRPVKLP